MWMQGVLHACASMPMCELKIKVQPRGDLATAAVVAEDSWLTENAKPPNRSGVWEALVGSLHPGLLTMWVATGSGAPAPPPHLSIP